MYILIVEDDPLQADLMIDAIKSDSSLSRARIDRISTELGFRQNFERIANVPPDIITIDIMLRWTDPSPELDIESVPREVLEEGTYKAGLRCESLLAENPVTRRIPVIIYTIVGKEDLGEDLPRRDDLVHLTKDSDLAPLIRAIRTLIR